MYIGRVRRRAVSPIPAELERSQLLAAIRQNAPLFAAQFPRGFPISLRGLRVSGHQLTRWNKAGLLPRPRRRSLGRGRGMASYYPAFAVVQALLIAGLLQIMRDLEDVRWAMWCFGFSVTEGVRQALLRDLEQNERRAKHTYTQFKSDVLQNPISQLTLGRAPRGLGAVRRSVGRAHMETLGLMVYEMMLGCFGEKAAKYDRGDYAAALKGLYVITRPGERAVPTPNEIDGARKTLSTVSREFGLPALQRALREASAPVLCLVRNEATAFYQSLPPEENRVSLLPREFFLLWFAMRVASPTLHDPIERAIRAPDWPRPEPALLQRIAAEKSRTTHGRRSRERQRTRL